MFKHREKDDWTKHHSVEFSLTCVCCKACVFTVIENGNKLISNDSIERKNFIFTVKYPYMYVPSQIFVSTVHLLVKMLLYLAIIVKESDSLHVMSKSLKYFMF